MKQILCILALFFTFSLFSQTATNFTCNDCSGTTYDLFTELDAGKVIVICWVMPCGSCVDPATTAYNVVDSFQTTHPGKVFFYLTDDFANTNCATIENWGSSNNMPASSYSRRFSNASINMAHYGTFGMPKIVVLAGTNHAVFYNANDAVSKPALTDAITQAIAATGTAEKTQTPVMDITVSPTLAHTFISIISVGHTSLNTTLSIFNSKGQLMLFENLPVLRKSESHSIGIAHLPTGVYYIQAKNESGTVVKRIVKL